jgi:hypothetical protein
MYRIPFEVESTVTITGRGGFVLARRLGPITWATLQGATLGGCPIEPWTDIPRALDSAGRQRIDLFAFHLSNDADLSRFIPGLHVDLAVKSEFDGPADSPMGVVVGSVVELRRRDLMQPDFASEEEHAAALIRAFVTRNRRERYLRLLASSRGRAKIRGMLAHFPDLDPRKAHLLPAVDHTPEQLADRLRELGAPPECVLLAEDPGLDGRRLPLEEALRTVVGRGKGAFVSCLPGRLAYYEGEYASERYLLESAV